jgi:sugar phosphate isomerase/epimerase
MSRTRTGSFPIGFRSWGTGWQQELLGTVAFAKANGFESIDTGPMDPAELKKIVDSGLRIGSVDLLRWPELASPDPAQRKAAAEDNAQVCEAIAPLGARVVLEGWPGRENASIACTPADFRSVLREIPRGCGINFDPSHLIRMGIDPVRFLEEFAPRVCHVHGKDTEIIDENLYEHGHLQEATFAAKHVHGGFSWRYTIPGHGRARWGKMLSQLKSAGYDGMVSIELEDEDFNGSEEGERRGLIAGRSFLEHA